MIPELSIEDQVRAGQERRKENMEIQDVIGSE